MRSSVSGKKIAVARNQAYSDRDDDFRETKLLEEDIPFIQDELDNVTTIIYLLIEGIRDDPKTLDSARTEICV
jgi:trans-2-enoyl-CoA reductase